MPGLSRHAPPLLRTINGKKHASNADHEEAQSDSSGLSEPPGDDEYDDLTRDPDPSSDEETEPAPLYIPPKNIRPPKRAQGKADSINIHAAKAKTNGRGKEQETKALGKSSGLKKPSTEEPKRFESPRSKHGRTFRQPKTSNETQETVVEAPRSQLDYVLESSQNSKRARVAYGSKSASSSQKARGKEGSNSQKGGLKRPREASADQRSPKRRFRNTADSSSQIESPSQATSVGFKRPAGSAELPEPEEMSSPPSTPSSPPPEVIDLASPQPPPGTSPCPLCGDHVEISFKEDFEIENCRGRHMSLKMQERFCQAHKSRNAQRTWKDRSYPEVDWSALAGRLEIHREHILAILNRKKESYFRDELERAIREGKARTVVQRYFAPDGSGARVGYYGTRGQKMMTDYILSTFSGELRDLGWTDKLLSATGASGGVSGYVQSVLVPELATCLVMEDADVDTEEARQIITESGDIGELLNAEEEENVPSGEDAPTVSYGHEDAGVIEI